MPHREAAGLLEEERHVEVAHGASHFQLAAVVP
jgi:hypothetical protein